MSLNIIANPPVRVMAESEVDHATIGETMHTLMSRLYPICRSLTGPGVRETLAILSEEIPLVIHDVSSGTRAFDWTVPKEWRIRDAYINDASGRRVVDFRQCNLHVVNYSRPVRERMCWSSLDERLHSLPEHPEWVPYRTSYYQESWGFCLSHRERLALAARGDDAEYEVVIDAELVDGSLTYGELFLPGESTDEVLFSCHICHPSLANDNLSGIAVATYLAKHLSERPRRYSYRFLFLPATIGALVWLSGNQQSRANVKYGLVLTLLGDDGPLSYKRSRWGNAEIDRAAAYVLKASGQPYRLFDFEPIGYDERQYCSPGINLPVGCLMRSRPGEYPEYHSSADNLDLVTPNQLADSLTTCKAIVDLLERNRLCISLNPCGEPQLGRRGLYRAFGGDANRVEMERAILWVLNLADGQHSLLDAAERSGLPFDVIDKAAELLAQHRLIEQNDVGSDESASPTKKDPVDGGTRGLVPPYAREQFTPQLSKAGSTPAEMLQPLRHACRFCGEPLIDVFVDLGMSPLCESYRTAEQLDQPEQFYPLCAYVCRSCLLVQLPQYVSAADIFSEYAYFSSYSDSWLQHARRYVEEMIERFHLGPQSQVVEIASNDGYLLQYFVERGVPALGIEPAANVARAATAKGVPTLIKFFGHQTAEELVAEGTRADHLVANNVLAHVPELNDFVAGVRLLLLPSGVATFEFPHLLMLIEGNQFDTLYHEHFCYFSFRAAEKVLAAHGLTVFDVEELLTHGGSLRLFARQVENDSLTIGPRVAELRRREAEAGLDRLDGYRSFAAQVIETKHRLLEFLVDAKRQRLSVAGYGAPGKGNTLLNYCGIRRDMIEYTVDRNPYKQGKFLPGTHIPIFSPERIAQTRPDYVLILPWNLKDEIVGQLSYIREWGGKFVVPIPRPTILERL